METKDIRREYNKLKKLYKNIPENKRKLVEGLLQNAAFMKVSLDDLQKEVEATGALIKCQSGNGFETIKDNPAQKAYTTMVSRYSTVIKQLEALLPAEAEKDEFEAF